MDIDQEKLDECALATLSLTLHDDKFGPRAWKGLDWNLLDRLFTKGWIGNPKGKARSVAFTDQGVERAKEFLEVHFRRPG